MPGTLSVIILTYNEAMHIERAIHSVKAFATDIFVIDSYSKDNTRELAEKAGATVIHHPFINYAKQFQWALDNAPVKTDWVMRLDADEIIEEDLAAEIQQKLPALPATVGGVNLKRKHIFMGHWVRHGGRYPLILLRIWRAGNARIEDRWMDEHMLLSAGTTVTFKGGFSDWNRNDLTFFTEKHNKYATREAIDVLNRKYHLFSSDTIASEERSPKQAFLKRWIKERFYNHLPFWAGPLGYFLYRYILQLGFLDGKTGLIYHFLQGFWYRFLVGAKVLELENAIGDHKDKVEIIAELERRTGHKLV